MSNQPLRIILSRREEEVLANLPPEIRIQGARELGLTDPHRGHQQASLNPLVEHAHCELWRGARERARLLVVAGLGLIIAAAMVVATTLIPEDIHNTPIQVACGLAVLGFIVSFFGLSAVYLMGPSRRLNQNERDLADLWVEAAARFEPWARD